MSSFWRTDGLGEVGLQRAREQVAEALDPAGDAQQVVVDVAEVRAQLRVDEVVLAAREPVDRGAERHDRAVEVEHLALHRVDPLGRVRAVGREHVVLDLLDVGLDRLHHRLVVVDDPVDDRVQHGAGAEPQQVRPALDLQPHVVQAALAVAHRHDEVAVDEQQDLAGLEVLLGFDVADRLEHHQQRVAVHLDLRPLVRVDRVLDRQLVQVELAPDGVELLLGRLVDAEPHERAVALGGLAGLGQRQVALAPAPVLVDRAVDDHRGGVCARRRR